MLFFQLAELIKATVHTHRIYETQRSSQLAGFRVEFSEFCAILKRQFKFTGVTGVSKFGTYSSTAVLEY